MKNIPWLLLIMAASSGCSLDASIEDLTKILKDNPVKSTGLTSGSTQAGTTTGGAYTVQATVGNVMSEIKQQSTDGTYNIYSSIQGTLVSP